MVSTQLTSAPAALGEGLRFFGGGFHRHFARLVAVLAQFAGVKLHVHDLVRARLERGDDHIVGLVHIAHGHFDDVVDAIAFDVKRVVILVQRFDGVPVCGDVFGFDAEGFQGFGHLVDRGRVSCLRFLCGPAVGLHAQFDQRPVWCDVDHRRPADLDRAGRVAQRRGCGLVRSGVAGWGGARGR